jgi:hypothetical protein
MRQLQPSVVLELVPKRQLQPSVDFQLVPKRHLQPSVNFELVPEPPSVYFESQAPHAARAAAIRS